MTKVVNRVVLGLAAILIICAGLVPKFAAVLTTIFGTSPVVIATITAVILDLILPKNLDD